MKRVLSIILALVMLSGMITVVHGFYDPTEDEIVYIEDFETTNAWVKTNGQGTVELLSDASHESYLKVTAENNGPTLVKSNLKTSGRYSKMDAGELIFDFDFKVDQAGANKHIVLSNGPNNNEYFRLLLKNSRIEYQGKTYPFTADEWHNIRLEIDLDNKCFDIYLDNKFQGKADFINKTMAVDVNYIQLRADKGAGYLAFDNMVLYRRPRATISKYSGEYMIYDTCVSTDSWSHSGGAYSLTVESDETHDSYIQLMGCAGLQTIYKRKFSGDTTATDVFEFDFKADNTNRAENKYMYFQHDNTNILNVYFCKNNKLLIDSTNSRLSNIAMTPDTWYHLRIEFDSVNKICNVYLDGELIYTKSIELVNFNNLTFRADKEVGYVAVDNIKLYRGINPDESAYASPLRFPKPTLPPVAQQDKTGIYKEYFNYNQTISVSGRRNDTFNLSTAVRAGKNITLEFDYKSEASDKNRVVSLYGNGEYVARVFLGVKSEENEAIKSTYKRMEDSKEITSPVAIINPNGENAWHHVKVIFDSYKRRYGVYCDDTLLYVVPQYNLTKEMEISQLKLDTDNDSPSLEISNVKLYDPDGTVQPDKKSAANVYNTAIANHVFNDMKGSTHFNGHWAEIPALTLNALGIMSGTSKDAFSPEQEITREQYIAILKTAFKFDENMEAELNGIGSGTPSPSDILKEEDAVAMAVTALGYRDEAEAENNGYPMGYIQVGNEKYISRGLNIHVGENTTRALTAQIVFYALGCEIKGQNKTAYSMHSSKAGAISKMYVDALLQDYYYYREEALEVMAFNGFSALQAFNGVWNEFKNNPDKEVRTRAARVLSEFIVPDTTEYGRGFFEKTYMELVFGRLNVLSAGDLAVAANDVNEDEDVRLYAIRALYLMDREDLVDKSSWTLAFKEKAFTVTRWLASKAQDVLEMTDSEETVYALIDALSDSDVEVVLRAIDTLGRKGLNSKRRETAQIAIPQLQKMLDHESAYVPFRAYQAIVDLGGVPEKEVAKNLTPYLNKNDPLKITVDGSVITNGNLPQEYKKVIVNNGNIEVEFDENDTRSFAGMKRIATADMPNDNLLAGYGFLTCNTSYNGGLPEHNGARSQGIRAITNDYLEYVYHWDPTELFPYTLELIYRLTRGESGIYEYTIVSKEAGSPATKHVFFGIMLRIDSSKYSYASVHDKLQYNASWRKGKTEIDTEYGEKDIYQSVYRKQNGETDAKHEDNVYNLETYISGVANERVGLWQIFPSPDSYSKLLKHDMTNPTSTWNEGQYFTYEGKDVPEGEYKKIYGPMMIYINKGNTFLDKWEDAKNKQLAEKEKWPYEWVEDEHYFDRGSLSGTVSMFDGSSAEDAYVVVNIPGITTGNPLVQDGKGGIYRTWQQNQSKYQYWTRVGADGKWSIDNVHAGTYSVTVWKEGYPGEVEKENVVVNKGENTDTGIINFTQYSNGTLAWRVGDADRTWLYNAEKNYYWEQHLKYRNRFPNDVVFKIGQSNPVYDWNYSQPRSTAFEGRNNPWQIIWDIDGNVPGDPVLTVATCGSRNTHLRVKVNGTVISELTYSTDRTADNKIIDRDDSIIIRTGSYGKVFLNALPFDKSLLKQGENVIELVQYGGTTDTNASISYDFVQLEYK